MTFWSTEDLSPEARIAVLEEHARQEMSWRGEMVKWRETVMRELTSLHVKVVFFSAIGSMVGTAVIGAIVVASFHVFTAGSTPAKHP